MVSNSASSGRWSHDAGFTLIETLAVLAILAISAGAIALSLPSSEDGSALRQDASSLIARLNLAAELALVESREIALIWDRSGYWFETRTPEGWTAEATPQLAGKVEKADGPQLARADSVNQGRLVIHPHALPDPDGPVALRLHDGHSSVMLRFDGFSASLGDK